MKNFKIGDRVRVKGYDEVQYHIGISREGWAEQFLKPCEVVAFEQGNYRVKTHTGTHWWVCPDSLIPLDNKILITHDGTTTLARMYEGNKVVKSAEAKCSPDDTFDFNVGAQLAFNRLVYGTDYRPAEVAFRKPVERPKAVKLYCIKENLINKKGDIAVIEYQVFKSGTGYTYQPYNSYQDFANRSASAKDYVPLVSRPAKVGERVYIANRMLDSKNSYANGDVCQVVSADGSGAFIRTLTGKTHNCNVGDGTAFLYHSEYLVLDGYQPEPEYWSGKVVCVDNDEDDGLTTGKVYKVEKGVMRWDNGDVMSHVFKSVDDLNDKFSREPHTKAKFIEFKGEASD